jgi:hypothetical protein
MRTAPLLTLALLAACNDNASSSPARCSSDADCADGNTCSVDACDTASGACGHAYGDAMATVVLTGGTGATARAVAETSGGAYPLTYTFCPGGPDLAASPPRCALEIDGASGTYAWSSLPDGTATASGQIPVRVANLPVSYEVLGVRSSATFTVTGNGACPPDAQTFVVVPVELALDLDAAPEGGVLVTSVTVSTAPVQDAVVACGGVEASLVPFVVDFAAAQASAQLAGLVAHEAEAQLCAAAPCVVGTDVGGICRHPSGACVARPRDEAGIIRAPACLG